MTFTNDELFLALIGLVRATRPGMLRQDADGFSIDFEAIAATKDPRDTDVLLLKLGAAMQGEPPTEEPAPPAGTDTAAARTSPVSDLTEAHHEAAHATAPGEIAAGTVSIDLNPLEARQIANALAQLEQLQAWPQDVLNLSRDLRARLSQIKPRHDAR
jgi:hypothetical protein